MVPGGNVDHQSEVTALSRQLFLRLYLSVSCIYTCLFLCFNAKRCGYITVDLATVASQNGVCIQFKKICVVMEMKGNNNIVFLSVTK
jgi:hypothetical protein